MSYSPTDHAKARLRWLQGESVESIAGSEGMPEYPSTIYRWKKEENWDAELEAVYERAKEYQRELIGKEIAEMNQTHITLARNIYSHAQKHITETEKLDTLDMDRVSKSVERMAKIERIAREMPSVVTEDRVQGNLKHEGKIELSGFLDVDLKNLSNEELEGLYESIEEGETPAVHNGGD